MSADDDKKGLPTVQEAEALLAEAAMMNPGPWFEHSQYAGKAAQLIAQRCTDMDAETALILGMLHDIGRRFGITGMRHIVDGYHFLLERGYYRAARVCMTHSFDCKDMRSAFGKWDCTDAEYELIGQFLNCTEYDDYDRLIQLCDALAIGNGYCLVEKRMVDAALRHGINEYTTLKWAETLKIKTYFEEIMGVSVYSLLHGVVENTFGI
jgi:hypothetical protein